MLEIITHGLLILAAREAPAAVLQPFSYTLLVWAPLWGVGFGGFMDFRAIVGALVVVASGIFVIYRCGGRCPHERCHTVRIRHIVHNVGNTDREIAFHAVHPSSQGAVSTRR